MRQWLWFEDPGRVQAGVYISWRGAVLSAGGTGQNAVERVFVSKAVVGAVESQLPHVAGVRSYTKKKNKGKLRNHLILRVAADLGIEVKILTKNPSNYSPIEEDNQNTLFHVSTESEYPAGVPGYYYCVHKQ